MDGAAPNEGPTAPGPEVVPTYRSGPWLALICSLSAAATVVMALAVFPNGSINDDEAIYRLQANTIAGGHLFPAARDPARAFVPWLAAIVQHHYVLKYTPVEAAVLAASHLLSGSYLPALVVTVVAVVVCTWLLASELLQDPREALVATAFVAASPIVVVESGLLLGYLTTLALLELFAWACVRGVRSGSGLLVGMAGMSFGVAAAIRQYDALIFAAPFLVWAGARLGRQAVRAAAWFVLGGAGPFAAFLVYNDMATGSPFKLPFNLQESHDTIGFGLRRLTAGEDYHHFGPLQGLAGVGVHLVALLLWVAGGPLLIALAVRAVRTKRAQGPLLALGATAVTVPLGYLVFWGPWNAGLNWGGIWLIGPFYFLPLVVAVGILGARGLTDWKLRHPERVRRGLVALVVFTVAVTTPAIVADARYSRQDAQVAALAATVPGPALVVLSDNPGFIMFPHWNLGNIGHPTGPVLYVAASGTAADFDLLRRFGDRIPYTLIFSGAFLPHRANLGAQLNRLVDVSGATLDLRALASRDRLRGKKLTLTVSTGGSRIDCGRPDSAGGWTLHVDPAAVTCRGAGRTIRVASGAIGSIRLKYSMKSGFRDQFDIPELTSGGKVTLLLPGPLAGLLRTVQPAIQVTPVG